MLEAHPLAKQIAVGLVAQYWGELDPDDHSLPDKLDGLTVDIREDGEGISIDDAISAILDAMRQVSP